VARLRETFRAGRTRPLEWREEQLRRLGELLSRHGDELVAALQADLRKPRLEAWMAEIASTRAEADLARKKLRAWTKPERVRIPLSQRPGRARIVREPLGVVLVIGPWNYPVQLVLTPLVGALAAGNCAVLKPSEVTAHTSAALARLVPRYLDPDAVAVVEGGVAETTALLAERFDHIFYTGNGRVGRVVMAAAAKHLTPVTLELGGKSPCLVDSDVDMDVAVRRIAWGKFLNAGQTCIAPDYVLVHESRERELLDGLARTLSEFYGDDPRRSPDLARIASDRHYERLAKLLESGEVVAGGQTDAAERYVAPTILRDVKPDSPVMEDEIFGPILPVLTVDSLDSASEFVNGKPKPLALYLFTASRLVARTLIDRIPSGGAVVNHVAMHCMVPQLPFGGVGASGMGAYHGRWGFEAMSHRRAVLAKRARPDLRVMYPPYTEKTLKIMRKIF
jgi:aldehyde dehydrogenase (NAD+)